MAEVRIPTEQIPLDILQRLQDIVDRKSSLMGTLCRGTAFTSLSAASQLLSPSASMASSMMPRHPSPLNVTSNVSLFASSHSSPYSQGPSETVFSMAKMPSAASSASTCGFAAATTHYSSATSSSRLPTFRTQVTAAGGDEVDGGSCDPVTQLSGPSPRKRRLVDVLDDSGIVRVFPMEDDLNSGSVVDEHRHTTQKDSEIVRIFPDMEANKNMVTESTIIRTLTPVPTTPRPGSVHVFDNTQELPTRKEWNFKPLHDNAAHSTKIPVCPRPCIETCDTTHRRPLRPFLGLCETPNKQANSGNLGNLQKSDPTCNKTTSCTQSSQVKHRPNEAEKTTNIRHFSSNYSRRSPELPTPPQTPDDGDVDIGDDEVFTFTSVGGEEKYLSQTCGEATGKSAESTPRRRHAQSRHLSDRTEETYQHKTHMSSSFGPAQQMSELNFGDRQKTRKRLSFDEVSATQQTNTNQHSYNQLPSIPQFPPQVPTSIGNNLFATHTSRVSLAGSNKTIIPLPKFHPYVLASSFPPCPSSRCSPQPHQGSVTTSQRPTPCLSPFHSSSRRSPVQDVFAILEKAVQKQIPASSRRSRLHSDSEYITEAYSQNLIPQDRSSPQQEVTNARRQTFSFGSRKHRDDENPHVKHNEEHGNSPTQTWPHEPKTCTEEDCYCSKIARNFLQMVERAYTGITQMDGTQAGFVRFRQELTQTNDILRESLNIVQNIRAMCQHSVRSLPGFSATQAQ